MLLTGEPSFQLPLVMIYEAQHIVGAVVLSLQCVAEWMTNSAVKQAKGPAWGVPFPTLLLPN